jgi:hypothetical protein
MKRFILLIALFLSACRSATPTPESQVVRVYATPAAQPWLTKLYACAADSSIVLKVNPESPEIYLRVGEPDILASPAYKIDEEEILIVTHRENTLQNLTLEQAQDLFALGNPSMQVWVYSSDADIQKAFDQWVMKGRSVVSSARVAVSPQNMFDILKSGPATLGILPRHWLTGDVREIFSVGHAPVLAVTKPKSQGAVMELISCLQGN